jgi:hypothetical protein
MNRINNLPRRIFGFILFVSASSMELFAQRPPTKAMEVQDASGNTWIYVTGALALITLGVVFYFLRKSRQSIKEIQNGSVSKARSYTNGSSERNANSENEPEWLRKARTSLSTGQGLSYGSKKSDAQVAQGSSRARRAPLEDPNMKAFQDRMKMLQFAQLPINSFSELVPPRHFAMLLDSDAEGLAGAVEQANMEFEKDERSREAAIKTLAALRTSNSVETLTQVALYDESASLRSKAVTVLADFDHESVFETILLACADPTREVRASAARAMFRLNFDRAGAWTRIYETNDEFRMSRAVHAAGEAGIVVKTFDRLVHEDRKIAYEAFTLVALLIKSGETNEIFTALRDHKDERVKYALLHVLKVIKDGRSLEGLRALLGTGSCTAEVINRIRDAVASLEQVQTPVLA